MSRAAGNVRDVDSCNGLGQVELAVADSHRPEDDEESPADMYNITKPLNHYTRGAQYLCFACALVGSVFFGVVVGAIDVSVQYLQIAFVTAITVSLNCKAPLKQRVWLGLAGLVATAWILVGVVSGIVTRQRLVAVTLSIVGGVCYLGGLLLLAFKALDARFECGPIHNITTTHSNQIKSNQFDGSTRLVLALSLTLNDYSTCCCYCCYCYCYCWQSTSTESSPTLTWAMRQRCGTRAQTMRRSLYTRHYPAIR
jgi:hypothetical protein